MPEEKNKFTLAKLREYLQSKKDEVMTDVSITSYVTKPRAGDGSVDPRVVVWADPKSHISEQFRSLRTNIMSLSLENPLQAFLVTSSLRGEGKTISSANLATVFAQDTEKKTILIDADLRKPNIHRVFGIPREPGLTEILNGKASLEHFTAKPRVDNLYIIPAGQGPSNPSELLNSSQMQKLIADLRTQFNWMVFDIAPILAVTDAGVLGGHLDGSLMVVRAGKTQAVDVERAYSLLIENKAKPIGSIMTAVVTYIPYYLYRYRYIYSRHYYGA
jgi:capsular exopolysaccharide synthesis family protein